MISMINSVLINQSIDLCPIQGTNKKPGTKISNMKIFKYILVCLFLLFTRGCDFYSTHLWIFEENGLQDERNPLTFFLGIGWQGLIYVNLIVIIFAMALYFIYSFKYHPQQMKNKKPRTLWQYMSLLFYEKENQWYKIFYSIPYKKMAFWSHAGNCLIYTLIIASLLATMHNLGQYYQLKGYQNFSKMIGSPIALIYTLIAINATLILIISLRREFERIYPPIENQI